MSQPDGSFGSKDVIVFIVIIVVGILAYILLFGWGRGEEREPASPEPAEESQRPVPASQTGAALPVVAVEEAASEPTVFSWSPTDMVGSGRQGDSSLAVPGGDVKAQYQKREADDLYIRLELYDTVSPSLVYNFMVNVALGTADERIYQVFTSGGATNVFLSRGESAEAIDLSAVQTHVVPGTRNIELKLSLPAVGMTRDEADRAAVRFTVAHYDGERFVAEDANQVRDYVR